jgi:hypothetical protein
LADGTKQAWDGHCGDLQMIKKTLIGVAIGCVLSTPAAFAEEYKGF